MKNRILYTWKFMPTWAKVADGIIFSIIFFGGIIYGICV